TPGDEAGACSRARRDVAGAAVLVEDLFGDKEAEAEAARAGGRTATAAERIEEAGEDLWRDGAAVFDGEGDDLFFAGEPDLDGGLAGAVVDGVRKEVSEDLLDANGGGGRDAHPAAGEVDLAIGRAAQDFVDGALGQLEQVDGSAAADDAAPEPAPGQIEHLADHAVHPVSGPHHALDDAAGVLIFAFLFEDLRAGHQRAQ